MSASSLDLIGAVFYDVNEALKEVVLSQNEKKMTVGAVLKRAYERLDGSGVPDARAESEYLLTHILKCKRHELFMNSGKPLTDEELSLLEEYIKRRIGREPAQYITGEVEFRGLAFKVTRDTLIPRPETELLVEEALHAARASGEGGIKIIDLCTGSGCIAVSVAKELPGCRVYATDISGKALKVARENAVKNGVAGRVGFFEGDLFKPLSSSNLYSRINLVLSNPPYVSGADMDKLAPEVKDYEPREALYGGEDGLDFIRSIINGSQEYLLPGGYLIMEIGYGQAQSIKDIALKTGFFEGIEVKKDYSGIERIFKARFKGRQGTKALLPQGVPHDTK